MVRRGRAKSVDPAQALRYRAVGEALLRSAGAMVELSDLDRYYGNAIAADPVDGNRESFWTIASPPVVK